MKANIFVLTLLLISACSTQRTIKSNEVKNDSINVIFKNGILTTTLWEKIPVITDHEFNLSPESDDSIENLLVKLNEQQLNYFYSTADWKEFNKMMAYKTYFYGKLPSRNGLLSILLINANGSSATSLDCFLINKKGKIAGVFEPSHIDYDSESFGKGEFVNDSTYKLNEINYRPLGEGNNTSIKDSSSTLIRINHWGIIQKEIIISKKDTITEEEQ